MATIAYRPDGTMVTGSAARRAIESGQATAPTQAAAPTNAQRQTIAERNTQLGFGTTTPKSGESVYTSGPKSTARTPQTITYQTDTTMQNQDGTEQDDTTISEMYSGFLPTQDSNLTDAQKAYRESLNYQEPMSDEDIMAKTRARMQAEIDALNKVYTEKLRQEAIAGRGRLGQSRAIQAASGQLGSTFGQAQKNVVAQENTALEEAIRNERLAKEIDILTEGKRDTIAEAEAQVKAKRESAKNILEYYAGQVTEKANRLKATVANMVNSGETIDETTFTEIAKALGVSPIEVKALYNATKVTEQDTLKTLSPGQVLVDSKGNPIFTAPSTEKTFTPTADIQNYNFYAEQERLAGRTPVSFAQFNTRQSGETLTPYQKFTATQSIAKDTQARTESAREMARQANLIRNSYQNIVNGGDRSLNTQAIITSFNKILDPTSVVRESEYDRTAAGQSLLNRLQGKYDNIVAGGAGVTLSTLEEAQKIAEEYLKGAQNSIVQQNIRAQEMATAFGLNPDFVTTGGFEQPTTQPQVSTDETYNYLMSVTGVAPEKSDYEEYVGQSIDDNTWQQISGSFNTPVSAGSTNSPAFKTAVATPDNTKGGQCGRFVNKHTGLGLGDSYASKMAKMDKSITQPEPGMVFVMPYKDTGHTGFILNTYINEDGVEMATVKDSNYFTKSAPETVRTHDIPVSKMTGFARV